MMHMQIDSIASPGSQQALLEIEEVLRGCTKAGAPNRLSAVRYTLCRRALLDGELRSAVPGFLLQCGSIHKFHEFITLYDPKVETRLAFLEAALSKCHVLAARKSGYDVFSDPDA
jgi:hypothetical protein